MVRPGAFRERAEEFERASLSTWAVLSVETKGRDRFEEPDPLRTAFQVDAHRIQRSAAFRRLAGKRAAAGPRGFSALEVTLEAARLADALARALRLNAELARAVALGHGLGTAPFGTAGAQALGDFGYEAAEQALRVVEHLEEGGAGLNLTWESRDGILTVRGTSEPATVEGQVARLAVALAEATLAPPPDAETTAAALEHFGVEVGALGEAFCLDAAQGSADRPEIRLGDRAAALLAGLDEAVAEARRADPAERAEHYRAVHCLQSLAIYALEHGAATGDAAARRVVVDDLSGRAEREVVDRYRARFEPRA